jgi:hypothetical protein
MAPDHKKIRLAVRSDPTIPGQVTGFGDPAPARDQGWNLYCGTTHGDGHQGARRWVFLNVAAVYLASYHAGTAFYDSIPGR